jgi:RHS repeat-associated protein
MTAHGSVLTASYTGDGLRAWKQNSSGRRYFLYDGIVPVVELDSSGSVTATNTFGAAGLVSRQAGSAGVFYSFDSEGNVAQRSDNTGIVSSNHLFSAYGSILSGSLSDAFGYKAQFGYYTDNETGLQLLTHRYYDSSTGRFLTRDPLGFAGGINSYAYVGNSPVLHRDPSGLCPPEKKCKQEKTGGDMDDIKEMLRRAGLLDQISIIGSAGQKNPEGIIFKIGNRQAFVDTLNADARFRHGTPFGGEHTGQVGGSILNTLDYRSFTTPDGLGIDGHGFRRSLQVDVGPPLPGGRGFGYADLDCDNPAQDVISGARHGFPIVFRRLGGLFGR